ncbi:hypothetical protein RUND412_008501 [Rhizina undulata]
MTPSCPEFSVQVILAGLLVGSVSTLFLLKALELENRRQIIQFNDRLCEYKHVQLPRIQALAELMERFAAVDFRGCGDVEDRGKETEDHSPNMRPTVGLCCELYYEWGDVGEKMGEMPPPRIVRDEGTHDGSF